MSKNSAPAHTLNQYGLKNPRSNALAQVSDFDVRLLRLFRTVVECGGFSAAEGVLGIGRSAISQHMSDLEQRLGLRVCQRGRAGFALTEEGRQVYQATLQMLAALESFRTEVNSLHQQLRGELNIGLTDNLVSLPHMRITHALAKLKQRGPEVKINIRMIAPSEIEQGVLGGSLHVGVVPQAGALPGLHYQHLYSERSLLYCAQEHPLFPLNDADISDAQLNAYDAIAPTFRLPAELQAHYQALNCSASASDREGMAFLIFTGHYIGYLPDHYAALFAPQDYLRALKPQQRFYDINLAVVTPKSRRPNLVLESFLELLGVAA